MAQALKALTVELFVRENTNGNTDWAAGSGTGEFARTASGTYTAASKFYAGDTLLVAGTAGSLAVGEFNLTGTTLTVRLPDTTFPTVAEDSDPDAAPDGFIKGFNQVETDIIAAIAAATEVDAAQIILINIDSDNAANVQLYRVESGGNKKIVMSVYSLVAGDTSQTFSVALNTGEKLTAIADGAIAIDINGTTRSTS